MTTHFFGDNCPGGHRDTQDDQVLPLSSAMTDHPGQQASEREQGIDHLIYAAANAQAD